MQHQSVILLPSEPKVGGVRKMYEYGSRVQGHEAPGAAALNIGWSNCWVSDARRKEEEEEEEEEE